MPPCIKVCCRPLLGMSSATLKWLPNEYRSTLMVPLEQHILHIDPLVPSPDVERELELYYRACILIQPNHFQFGGGLPHRDHMADRCCNKQLKMTLFSTTGSQKVLAVFFGILQGHNALPSPCTQWCGRG